MITVGQWLDAWKGKSMQDLDDNEKRIHDLLKDMNNRHILDFSFRWNRDIIKKDHSQVRLTDPESGDILCIDYYDNGQIIIWQSLRNRNLNISLLHASKLKQAIQYLNHWNGKYRSYGFSDVKWNRKRDYTDGMSRNFTEYTKKTWKHTIKLVTARRGSEKACQLYVDDEQKSQSFRDYDETTVIWMVNTYLRKNYGINLLKDLPDVI